MQSISKEVASQTVYVLPALVQTQQVIAVISFKNIEWEKKIHRTPEMTASWEEISPTLLVIGGKYWH